MKTKAPIKKQAYINKSLNFSSILANVLPAKDTELSVVWTLPSQEPKFS